MSPSSVLPTVQNPLGASACPPPECPTMLHYLERSVAVHPSRPFLGHRPRLASGEFGPYTWQTYSQVYRRIRALAAGLVHHNMVTPTSDTGDCVLGIYMKNRPEWVVAHYAAMMAGGFSVALYDTLGADSTLFILNQTQTSTVVSTVAELTKLIQAKISGAKFLHHVVLVDVDTTTGLAHMGEAQEAGLTVWALATIETAKTVDELAPAINTTTGDCNYTLIYTSGTTGEPKGVPLTHSNLVHAIAAQKERARLLTDQSILTPDAVHFSYLPLAHSIEHFSQSGMVMQSASIAFYQGDTTKILEDLALARPTFFGVVPRLLNKIYDKVVHGGSSGLKGWLLGLALRTKLKALKNSGELRHGIFDALIFSAIQRKIGLDRCSMVIVGSAPLAADVMDFFRILFDCPVMEAYGLSETTGIATMNLPTDTIAGDVGKPLGENQVKLISVPEMGYLASDTRHGDDLHRIAVKGRGEVCFRGPQVFRGYYKNPSATAQALDDEGWLHTGDIGVLLKDGRIKIVDRKKNIFKLSQGEYVAPERLENILTTSALVEQVFVYGDSFQSVLVAVVVPQEGPLRALTNAVLGAEAECSASFEALCQDARVAAAVLKDLVAVSKQAQLFGFETVKAIKLHPHAFTVENNMLTPTFKLKRNECKVTFADDIAALYAQCGDRQAGKP